MATSFDVNTHIRGIQLSQGVQYLDISGDEMDVEAAAYDPTQVERIFSSDDSGPQKGHSVALSTVENWFTLLERFRKEAREAVELPKAQTSQTP